MEPTLGSSPAPGARRRLRIAGGAATSAELASRIFASLGAPRLGDPCAALRAYAAHLRSLGGGVVVEIAETPPAAPDALRWLTALSRAFPGALELALEPTGERAPPIPEPRPPASPDPPAARAPLPMGRALAAGPPRPADAGPGTPSEPPRAVRLRRLRAPAVAAALAGALALPLGWIAWGPGIRGSAAPAPPAATASHPIAGAAPAAPAATASHPIAGAAPAAPPPADPGAVRVDEAGRVSFDVVDLPLAELLRELEARAGFRVTSLVGERLDRPVRASAEAVPLEGALASLLRDFETTFSYGDAGAGSPVLQGVLILAERRADDGGEVAVANAVERLVATGEPEAWQELVAVLEEVGPRASALAALRDLAKQPVADPSRAGRTALARVSLGLALCRAWGPEVAEAIRASGIELACPGPPAAQALP